MMETLASTIILKLIQLSCLVVHFQTCVDAFEGLLHGCVIRQKLISFFNLWQCSLVVCLSFGSHSICSFQIFVEV